MGNDLSRVLVRSANNCALAPVLRVNQWGPRSTAVNTHASAVGRRFRVDSFGSKLTGFLKWYGLFRKILKDAQEQLWIQRNSDKMVILHSYCIIDVTMLARAIIFLCSGGISANPQRIN